MQQAPDKSHSTFLVEQRIHPRYRANVGLHVGGAAAASGPDDLSLCGMFVAWADPLPPGSLLPLTLDLPDGRIEVTAEVVRAVPGRGMGMRFEPGSEPKRCRLARFLGS